MLIIEAKYAKKKVIQRVRISDEVHGCDCCGSVIPNYPNEPSRLNATVFYQSGESKHLHFCSWACVLNQLPKIKTDYFISLPFVSYDNAKSESGMKKIKKRMAPELMSLLKKLAKKR